MVNQGLKYRITKYAGLGVIRSFEILVKLVDSNGAFYNKKEFPFAAELEKNWELIQAECFQVITEKEVPNIQDIFKEQELITEKDNWKSYMLSFYGHDFVEHQLECPSTAKLINKIPGMSSAMFSILAPRKYLPPHRGPYKGVLRFHLGLIVPGEGKKCWIRVDKERYYWKEGEGVVFDDTFEHEAHNESDEPRVVLFVDIIRELPFPLNLMNKAIFNLMKKSPFIQNVLKESSKEEAMKFKKRKLQF